MQITYLMGTVTSGAANNIEHMKAHMGRLDQVAQHELASAHVFHGGFDRAPHAVGVPCHIRACRVAVALGPLSASEPHWAVEQQGQVAAVGTSLIVADVATLAEAGVVMTG